MDDAFDNDSDSSTRGGGFLPDFCHAPVVLGVVISAELLGFVLALASPGGELSLQLKLVLMAFFVLAIAMIATALLCFLRPLLLELDRRLAAVFAWLTLVATAGMVTGAAYALIPATEEASILPSGGIVELLGRALIVSAILGAMIMRYLYLHHMWRQQVRAEAEARLQKLQARIRPHFLFNSMNTIASLTQTNPQLAEEVVQDLADLFRASLSDSKLTSTLAAELELAYRYLNIERQRLGERLQILWDVEDTPGDAPLPALILQPLVENAVYHGIAPSRRPGLIQISGRYRRAQVSVSVRNTLPGESESANRHTSGNRMALDNVKQRMAAMFEGEAKVIVSQVEGDYQVRLVFPYPWKQQ